MRSSKGKGLFGKLLSKPSSFMFHPAPGWRKVMVSEIETALRQPLSHIYKHKPVILNRDSKSKLIVKNLDFRQGIELVMRSFIAERVDWIVLRATCRNIDEAKKLLMAKVPWEIFPTDKRNPWSLQVFADKNTQKVTTPMLKDVLSECFTRKKLKPLLVDECDANWETGLDSNSMPFILKVEHRNNTLFVSVCCAGAALYKRGYKSLVHAVAPLKEHHAAACLAALRLHLTAPAPIYRPMGSVESAKATATSTGRSPSTLSRERPMPVCANADTKTKTSQLSNNKAPVLIWVPFAGSGTLGFESLLQHLPLPSNAMFGRKYALEKWAHVPTKTVSFLRQSMEEENRRVLRHWITPSLPLGDSSRGNLHLEPTLKVYFSDINATACDALQTEVWNFLKKAKVLSDAVDGRAGVGEEGEEWRTISRLFHPVQQLDFLQTPRSSVDSRAPGSKFHHNSNYVGTEGSAAFPSDMLMDLKVALSDSHDSTNISRRSCSDKNNDHNNTLSSVPILYLCLNPPHGNRLGKQSDMVRMYRRIAARVIEVAQGIEALSSESHSKREKGGGKRGVGVRFRGFIICPDEDTWASFVRTLGAARSRVGDVRRRTRQEQPLVDFTSTHFTNGHNARLVMFWGAGAADPGSAALKKK
jgi:23S rRNA G2445 N2-methylase RlmL